MPGNDQWTVNPADEALEFEGGKYAIASWDLDWHPDANGSLPSHAHAALVQDVRDARMLPVALAVLADLVGDEDCSHDHHGYCQTHCWLQAGICPHKRAKALLGLTPMGNPVPE